MIDPILVQIQAGARKREQPHVRPASLNLNVTEALLTRNSLNLDGGLLTLSDLLERSSGESWPVCVQDQFPLMWTSLHC